MTASVTVSLAEYLSTKYRPDCEWLDGELIERNMGEFDHAGLQGLITMLPGDQRRACGIHIFPELRIQVSPTRYRVPDITVTTTKGRGRVLSEPPFLCVEIVASKDGTAEDRMGRMESKIDELLRFGVRYIWLIDPSSKKAWIYTSQGRQTASGTLSTSGPDLTLSIDELFNSLDEEIEA